MVASFVVEGLMVIVLVPWLFSILVLWPIPQVASLDNGLARTPPLGLSTWAAFNQYLRKPVVHAAVYTPAVNP
jgi:hypothetical protein